MKAPSRARAIRVIARSRPPTNISSKEGFTMSTITAPLKTTAIRIAIGGRTWLNADIAVPEDAKGLVLFAHGSGSGRHSPRNRYVASELNSLQLATVLSDLLTDEEEKVDDRTGALRFDISLLTNRLVGMIDWTRTYGLVAALPIGVFGASTGAAAALDAAALRPDIVRAVVSRGGRPDLATRLDEVKAPTLLIVGGNDTTVLELNRAASRQLTCTRLIEVVPGATHLFEQPGTLEAVAAAAGVWFQQHLTSAPAWQS
jgi:putative phosphoribosyl transferase